VFIVLRTALHSTKSPSVARVRFCRRCRRYVPMSVADILKTKGSAVKTFKAEGAARRGVVDGLLFRVMQTKPSSSGDCSY
jgi:hypothetical protein